MWMHEWDVGYRGIDDAGPSMHAPIFEPHVEEHQIQIHHIPILDDLHLDSSEVSIFIYVIKCGSKSFISILFILYR